MSNGVFRCFLEGKWPESQAGSDSTGISSGAGVPCANKIFTVSDTLCRYRLGRPLITDAFTGAER